MFGRDNKESDLDKVQQVLSGASVAGVSNLSARQNGNLIEIHGEAKDLGAKQAAFKTITERVGDTGVVNMIHLAQERPLNAPLNAPLNTSLPRTPAGMTSSSEERTYTVKKGDTLSHIAQQFYGKASEYNKIFEANRDKLKDPDKIREGITLRIP